MAQAWQKPAILQVEIPPANINMPVHQNGSLMNAFIHLRYTSECQAQNLTSPIQKYIKESNFRTLFRVIDRMLLGKLKKAFTENWTGRALGAALAFGAVATPIAAIPGPANDAYAQSGQIASAPAGRELNAVQGMRDMRRYSEDAATRGVGVFINLQADAPLDGGEKLGSLLKNAFAKKGIPLEFRVNQSRGTATDATFYVRGVDVLTLGIGEIKAKLGMVLNHHRGAWLPETASLEPNKPGVTR